MRDPSSPVSYGLTPFQQVLAASSLRTEGGLNIEQVVCTSGEILDQQAFQKSWETILQRHAALRVKFGSAESGTPCQTVQADLELPFFVEQRRHVAPEMRAAFVEDWLARDRARNFDFTVAPLMRVTLLRFADDQITWVWTFHHILLDGRSVLLVLDDFFNCYRAYLAEREPVLPERREVADFVAWQQAWLASHEEAAKSFWRETVTNDETASRLGHTQKLALADRRQEKLKLRFPVAMGGRLEEIAREWQISLNTLMQGAWALVLSRYYRSNDVTFATVHACRKGSLEGTVGMVGLLMNPVPVHAHVTDTARLRDFFQDLARQQQTARDYQWTPWELIRAAIPVAASKQFSDSCVLFEHYDLAQELSTRFGEAGTRSFSLRERPNIPLFLSISQQPQLQAVLNYQCTAFETESVADMGRRFVSILGQVLEKRGGRIEDLKLEEDAALGERYRQARAYWEARLSTLPPRPTLATVTDPQRLDARKVVRLSGTLGKSEWLELRKSAARLRVTPTAFLLTAFAEVLGKWANQSRFALTLVRGPRLHLSGQAPLPGETDSALSLLEVDLDAPGFAQRAQRQMATMRQDRRHSLFTGEQVIQALREKQALPDNLGLPITFTGLASAGAKAGKDEANHPAPSIRPDAWLHLAVEERDHTLVFHWDALEGLHPAGMMEDMFWSYGDYLQRLGRAPEFADLPGPALPPAQQIRRTAYNKTEKPYTPGLLHAGFFAMALTQPGLLAVDDPTCRVTYGELAQHAFALATRLRAANMGAGRLVAVVMDKGWEQIAAVLGILRAGAAYLPIDPETPAARIGYLLTNGGVSVALTQKPLASAIAWPIGVEAWTLEEPPVSPLDPGPEPAPDSLAYVIYTSGSTGAPKGVMITHEAALNTIVDLNDRLEIGPTDRVLSISALSFDLSVYDIFGLLARGAALVLPATAGYRDPAHWTQRMREAGVTIWNSAPALMQMLVTVLESSEEVPFAALRSVMLSGDWIPIDLPGRIHAFAPNGEVLSLGGATEVSIWSIAFPIKQLDPAWTSIPYGMPLANQSVHVLSERFEPCPEWTSGEIYIGGKGLALGYLADETKTAERFVRSPVTGEMIYRTGDFGRFRPEGFVEFLGRKDTQVKIRGYRIEMGEVEAALLRLPGVREAAALAVAGETGDRSSGVLVGCVVESARSNGPSNYDFDEGSARARLAEFLPAHIVPARIVALPNLPLSANGKIDRAALLQHVLPALTSDQKGSADEPTDLLERAIWRIWQEILPNRRIGRRDHFNDIGGDSLSVLHMIARVEKMVGRPIGLRPMQVGGTILALAAAAREDGPVAPPPMIVCVQPGAGKSPLFFAHGDLEHGGIYTQRLASYLGPDQPLYVISPHGTFGEGSPGTFQEIAAGFVNLIRSVQPKGPYNLGGFCNGALAMYEAAQQLTHAGETVTSLVMLDPPDLYLFLSRRKLTRVGKYVGLPDRQGRNAYQRLAEGYQIWRDNGSLRLLHDFLTRTLVWTRKSLGEVPKPTSSKTSAPDLNSIYYDAMRNYEPQPYLAPSWIILRDGESYRHAKQVSYWGGFMPGVHFERVPGTHLELRENMKEIGDIIRLALGQPTAVPA